MALADGNTWTIAAEDHCGKEICDSLALAMQLSSTDKYAQNLLIIKNGMPAGRLPRQIYTQSVVNSLSNNSPVVCKVAKPEDNDTLAIELMELSLIFCSKAETHGGLLIHGGLAEKNGQGIILAGPGDIGKTTASRRLQPPWFSLSDDSSLIVKDKGGRFHVHPWPSWGSFMFGGQGGSWNVQHSVPLKAIFLLKQSKKDFVEPLGKGQAVSLLNETAEQVWLGLSHDFDNTIKKEMRLQRFENICEMIKVIPVYLLHLSLTGSFWKEIDKVLD